MNKYIPRPIDTSDVILPQDLLNLAEILAENVHEVWAENRLSQGWTYGETRDDVNKRTPCLVSFHNLPESEKIYDRNTALSTLKLIIKLGFKISKD